MSVYDIITGRIVALLEQGTVPWRKPWHGEGGAPRNLVSKKPYRGINIWLLACQEWESPWWLTFKQAVELGGHVTKGEKGTPVVFWRWLEGSKDEDENDERRFPLLRYYTVFNVEQCSGLAVPAKVAQIEFDPIEACEAVVHHMPSPPAIKHRGGRACYRPLTDTVTVPRRASFDGAEAYYSVLFHELAHSTGHASRLARKSITDLEGFGSHAYSREELVAEFAASFLCGHCDIANATIENSAAYLQTWLARLNDDKHLVVTAAAQGQKAADYILNVSPPGPSEEPS